MGSFRTKEGRCVVEHGEIHLERLGVRGHLTRRVKNAKLSHEQRYDRGILRFVVVLVFGLISFGQLAYRVVVGGFRSVLLGVGIVVAVLGVVYGFTLLARVTRRRFQGFTSERTIPLRTVESVDPHPKQPLRRPYFVIRYDEYGDGNQRKRRVGVCSLTPLAEDEFETAKTLLFDDHDLSITRG